jgi:hypothetical protein
LRTLVQQSKNIRFIFCGSEQHILNDIFNEYNQPFYQSTRMMELGKIDEQAYMDFILDHFHQSRKQLPENIAKFILILPIGTPTMSRPFAIICTASKRRH